MRIDSDDDSSSVASEETFEELAPRSPSMDFGSSPPRRSRALKGVVDTSGTRARLIQKVRASFSCRVSLSWPALSSGADAHCLAKPARARHAPTTHLRASGGQSGGSESHPIPTTALFLPPSSGAAARLARRASPPSQQFELLLLVFGLLTPPLFCVLLAVQTPTPLPPARHPPPPPRCRPPPRARSLLRARSQRRPPQKPVSLEPCGRSCLLRTWSRAAWRAHRALSCTTPAGLGRARLGHATATISGPSRCRWRCPS